MCEFSKANVNSYLNTWPKCLQKQKLNADPFSLIFFFFFPLFLYSDVIMVNCLFMLLQLLALTDTWYNCCLCSPNSLIIFVVAGLLGKGNCLLFFYLVCV